MKKGWILLVFALIVSVASGQQQTEYNIKGDAAMERADYTDAKMWYEEGVAYCDLYSIDKITDIWRSNPEMRVSMRSLVNKCFNCLTTKSAENDTTAIRTLIHYHKEGIGVPNNKTLASYWTQRLAQLSRYSDISNLYEQPALKKERQMDFFIGYNYSIEAPFGLTFGAVGKRMGWYMRLKSNFSFAKSDKENNDFTLTPNISDLYKFDKDKVNSHAGSAGFIYKWTDAFHTSVGVGYGVRDLLWHYSVYSEGTIQSEGWSKNKDSSNEGVLAEVDLIWSFGKMFVSAGCYTVNFKYVDLNAGIGVYF